MTSKARVRDYEEEPGISGALPKQVGPGSTVAGCYVASESASYHAAPSQLALPIHHLEATSFLGGTSSCSSSKGPPEGASEWKWWCF